MREFVMQGIRDPQKKGQELKEQLGKWRRKKGRRKVLSSFFSAFSLFFYFCEKRLTHSPPPLLLLLPEAATPLSPSSLFSATHSSV